MIHDAEKNAEQDKILREKIEAKASLENYLYNMRATISDRDKLADKLESGDKSAIKEALDDGE